MSQTQINGEQINGVDGIIDGTAQAAGYLTGDTDVVLADFQTLGAGSNDGGFSVNVDGIDYADLSIDLSDIVDLDLEVSAGNSGGGFGITNNHLQGQSFTVLAERALAKVSAILKKTTTPIGTTQALLYAADAYKKPTGAILDSSTTINNADLTISFASYDFIFNDYDLSIGKYCIVLIGSKALGGNTVELKYNSSSVYSGGMQTHSNDTGSTWTTNSSNDLAITIYQEGILENVGDLIQAAIRNYGNGVTVAYDTDHFVITSATLNRESKVLKLTAPSTGTDISVAGYLDLGANATETAGTGDENRLVKTDEDGNIPEETFPDWLINLKP